MPNLFNNQSVSIKGFLIIAILVIIMILIFPKLHNSDEGSITINHEKFYIHTGSDNHQYLKTSSQIIHSPECKLCKSKQ